MKLEDHIKILQSIAIKHKWLYTKMILQLAQEHLNKHGVLKDEYGATTEYITLEEFLRAICLRGVRL